MPSNLKATRRRCVGSCASRYVWSSSALSTALPLPPSPLTFFVSLDAASSVATGAVRSLLHAPTCLCVQELVLAELRNTLRAKAPQYEALVTDALIQQQTRRPPTGVQRQGRPKKAAMKRNRGGRGAAERGTGGDDDGDDDDDDDDAAHGRGVAATPEEAEEFVLVEDVASAVTFRVRLANTGDALQVGHLKQEIAHTRKLKAADITLLFTHGGKRLAKLKDTAALTDVGMSHGSELKMLLNMNKSRKERFEAEFESVFELGKNKENQG